jgi:hypothetical protein
MYGVFLLFLFGSGVGEGLFSYFFGLVYSPVIFNDSKGIVAFILTHLFI